MPIKSDDSNSFKMVNVIQNISTLIIRTGSQ